MTPLEFLSLLWKDKPETLYILVWSLQGKRSHWFREIAAAAQFVHDARRVDVYVGVGVANHDYGPDRRCASEGIAGLAGFWADLDLKSDAHKKTLPATIDEALTIIPSSLPPTMTIATGNGAHVWWVFKDPWIFRNDEERRDASDLVSRFQTLLHYNSQQHGWAFDRLSDLARVLRIPGTINLKDVSNPKPIELHSFTERHYGPSEFREYLDGFAIPDANAQLRALTEWAERFTDKPLVIDLTAVIPDERLARWMEHDIRFRETWNHQRHDLNDQSQSGCDLALACFGLKVGLAEQQIVNLIIHNRRLHGAKQCRRLDY
ncbi:MAG TPA: hypothetical protein VE398_22100, partial [Acidobacteriota bacterium]|nr:hypothetical protein [Acidobacteriota bacterium]